MTFSEKLKYLRSRTGHAQTQTAEAIGITPQYYFLLEGGKRRPGDRAIEMISDYYGISPDFLTNPAVTEAGLKPPDSEPEEQRQDAQQLTSPTAAKDFLFRMNDAHLCTAQVCEWRQRVDESTYYCPAGCMKAGE